MQITSIERIEGTAKHLDCPLRPSHLTKTLAEVASLILVYLRVSYN